ncbi:hypothetical protein F5887DRAFT_1076435 [Amanita rubescens]|nr:hypothetical protein F5887DRAFT_1076435 [Amanita rubescens]
MQIIIHFTDWILCCLHLAGSMIMTFVNSLHKQYLMTSSTIGSLRQAFDVLHHKGLVVQSTKGPFWHNLDEAIHHIAEAHFHACWLEVGNVTDLKDLKQKNPDELKAMSMIILETHASQRALVDMQDSRTTAEQDLVQIQWTLWNKDVLPYIELRHAVRAGDIGCMEEIHLWPFDSLEVETLIT